MLSNKTVAVVVPAYNEEKQISRVIKTMPSFVDRIIIIDDCSTDNTIKVVKKHINYFPLKQKPSVLNKKEPKTLYNHADIVALDLKKKEQALYVPSIIINNNYSKDKIVLIKHKKNSGPGAALATGYSWCRQHNYYCTAVMAGDGQMDPGELKSICSPIVHNEADYAKGNRLTHRSSLLVIPKIRFFGNSILSLLTKIASGYWHVSDTQSGYTAISLKALQAIRLYDIYRSYGVPNDVLVKLNIAFCTIKEISIKPVYNIGEKSKMKIWKVIFPISWLLFKSFFKRLYIKYLFRDFHPLFLLYNLGFFLSVINVYYAYRVFVPFFNYQSISTHHLIIFFFLSISALQSIFFAMWMDMQDNARLEKF